MKQIIYLMLLAFKTSLVSVKDFWHKLALEAAEKMVDIKEKITLEEVTLKEKALTEEKKALNEEVTTRETTALSEGAASTRADLNEKAFPEIINSKEEAALEKKSSSVKKINGVKEAVIESMNKN